MNTFATHRLAIAIVLLGVATCGRSASLSPVVSLCAADETAFFSCRLARSTKVASLCGHVGAPRSWLQYRIGVPGRTPELLLPASADDPDDIANFFADGPSGTRDNSYWQVGVWFQHLDATYELHTEQYHAYQDGRDDASEILVWRGEFAQGAPKAIVCMSTSPSSDLTAARDLVEAASPSWHHWGLSPGDWSAAKKNEEQAERAAALAASAAR